MHQLDQLPLEVLFLITSYLAFQGDINALVRSNRTLYHALRGALYKYNVQHNHSSALLHASKHGHTHLIKPLLDAGASVRALETQNFPVKSSLSANANFHVVNDSQFGYFPEKDKLREKNKERHYALLLAAQGGHFTTLEALLSEPCPDQACTTTQLRVVLHWAIRSHKDQYVALLLDNDAPLDPASNGKEELSALGVAVEAHYKAIVPRLIELGAQPGLHEIPGPIECALRMEQREIAKFLLEGGIRQTSDLGLIHAAENNDNTLLQLLIDTGADIQMYGHAALFYAIKSGQYNMVEALIDRGANPHLSLTLIEHGGSRCLGTTGFAVWFHHLDILKLLLAKGVQPEIEDLCVAKEKSFEQAKTLLLPALTDAPGERKEDVADYVNRQESARELAPENTLEVTRSLLDPDVYDEHGNCAHQ
ncbi:Ankyrin repeats 3 copy [Aspergillus parasiticus SU-1]|uniref:Ankyrin repeats 3 copy n=1 Tax=Aspergillus parasiticus (strain ATCC 56775 / NRRL 5862 / SRRC 143 / SU-1) TaxID=1403190 RepID=A0A0F0IJM3_ASPPU|nr:Ankyrin repeats 3 copy [Aspergillus parasiticus SU-1]